MHCDCRAYSYSSFLGEHPASAQENMTVGEAFSTCCADDLLDALFVSELEWRAAFEVAQGPRRQTLVRRIGGALDVMEGLACDADANGDADASSFLAPLERFESRIGSRSCLVRNVTAVSVDAARVLLAPAALEAVGGYASCFSEARAGAALLCSTSGFSDLCSFDLSSLARDSWSSTLSKKIVFSTAMSSFDRHCVLARIFWMMTYRGYDFTAATSGANGRRERGVEHLNALSDTLDSGGGDVPSRGDVGFFQFPEPFETADSSSGAGCGDVEKRPLSSEIEALRCAAGLLSYNCKIDLLRLLGGWTQPAAGLRRLSS